MNIKFKFIDEKNIKIMGIGGGEEKEIGCIFTPAGSGERIINAIQICGISEVYDFWGCANYVQPKDLNPPKRVIDAIKGKKEEFIQSKDIQLLFKFDMETEPNHIRSIFSPDFDKNCLGCFNKPCTCDNKDNEHISPYNVKREEDVECEYLDDGKIHLKEKETEEFLKKLNDK